MYPIVIGICGKSAAGKDFVATRLVEEYKKIGIPAKKVISYTTRPPREGEVDGVDYHFVNLETFIEMQYDNKFIEHTEFRGWRYGTAINSFDNNCVNICVLNPTGMDALNKYYRNTRSIAACELFYLKVPFFTRLKRSIKREHTFKWEFVRRAFADNYDFLDYDEYFGCMENEHLLPYCHGRIDFVSKIMNNDRLIYETSKLEHRFLSK